MTAARPRSVGEIVEWDIVTRGTFRGTVIERGTQADSDEVDVLMGREPGTGWVEFGALLSIRCTGDACSCHPASEFLAGAWLHRVDECQVRTPSEDVEVGLW